MDFGQKTVPFLHPQQASPGGISDQLLSVGHIELTYAGGRPDDATQRIRYRAPQDVGNAGECFQQGRYLRATKFRNHKTFSRSRISCAGPSKDRSAHGVFSHGEGLIASSTISYFVTLSWALSSYARWGRQYST